MANSQFGGQRRPRTIFGPLWERSKKSLPRLQGLVRVLDQHGPCEMAVLIPWAGPTGTCCLPSTKPAHCPHRRRLGGVADRPLAGAPQASVQAL